MAKNVIIFGVYMSSSLHIDDRKKEVLILGKGRNQVLDHTAFTAEAQFSINFSRSNRKLCLSLQYNRSIILFIC